MWQLTSLQTLIRMFLALTLSILSILGLNNFLLFYFRVRLKREISVERPSHIGEWPFVTVQVATYNEKNVISRLLESCLKLDYPAGKLEIVIVDDSNDETIDILRDYERKYYPRIKVIHRSERSGYKAGALNEALKHSRGEFFLILDADSVPEADFLKKTIPLFLADSRLGFVQGKIGYLNVESSWLMRAFALVNDWFSVFTQSALSREGMIMSFIGHGGVFRRKAIEDVGGWMSDTITEDMDMAYRVQLKGWRGVFVEEAVSLEEIPPSYYSAIRRFKRHIKGPIQNLIKHGKSVLKHNELGALGKVEALILLSYPLVYPLGLLCLSLTTLMYLLIPGPLLDGFWCSTLGFLYSILMLLTFPYGALVVAFIPSALIIIVASLFALVFLLRKKRSLEIVGMRSIFGTMLILNDNLVNCLIPLKEILAGGKSSWLPTERSVGGGRVKWRRERKRAAILRIAASALVFTAFSAISYLNFSFSSLGILVPAVLWLYSAFLILGG